MGRIITRSIAALIIGIAIAYPLASLFPMSSLHTLVAIAFGGVFTILALVVLLRF